MDNLKVKIGFKSGTVKDMTSSNFYKGQFNEWCEHNFMDKNGKAYGFVVGDNSFINVDTIEFIEEVKD